MANCGGATAAVFRGLRVNLNRVCWIQKLRMSDPTQDISQTNVDTE